MHVRVYIYSASCHAYMCEMALKLHAGRRMDAEWRAGVTEHVAVMHVMLCVYMCYMCCVGEYRQKCSDIIYIVRPGLFWVRQNAIFSELCMVVYACVERRVGCEHWGVDRCTVIETLATMTRMHQGMVHCVHVECELTCICV